MAKGLTILYLAMVFIALALLLSSGKESSLAGIYLVFVTVPWPIFLGWLNALLKIDSVIFNTLFLLTGGLVNGLIIYGVASFFQRRVSVRRSPRGH